jgi:YndJ-like protein
MVLRKLMINSNRVAAAGLSCWVALVGTRLLGFGPLSVVESIFLLALLVLIPLCAEIVDGQSGLRSPAAWLARFVTPVGALLVVASFWVNTGPLAGALAGGWVLACALMAASGIWRIARGEYASVSGVCSNAAFMYLLVGSGWLMLYRLGVSPFGYAPATVFLAAVHFHFSGCVLPVIVGATISLRPSMGRRSLLAIAVAAATFAGPAMLAVGNVRRSTEFKSGGALLLVAAACGLAMLVVCARSQIRSAFARLLLLLSVVSLIAGMSFVAIYAVAELLGRDWISVVDMGNTHGPLNAVGFALFALVAFRLEQRRPEAAGEGE